jgi:hypothetical protein
LDVAALFDGLGQFRPRLDEAGRVEVTAGC